MARMMLAPRQRSWLIITKESKESLKRLFGPKEILLVQWKLSTMAQQIALNNLRMISKWFQQEFKKILKWPQ